MESPVDKMEETEDGMTAEKLQSLKEKVFKAAEEGNAEEIKAVLSGLPDELVREVLHHHAPSEEGLYSPLTAAISYDNPGVARLLLEDVGVDIGQSAALDASGHKYKTALFIAVERHQLDIAKILVERGADVNEVGKEPRTTALHEACFSGNLEMVQFLVDKGARTDVLDESYHTCLMEACRPNNEETVKFLLKRGADPNQSSGQWTALHCAALWDAGEIGEMLIAHGAVMTQATDGYTPLIRAILRKRSNFVHAVVRSPVTPREEKILGLELWGALCIPEYTNEALQYLKEALIERYRDPSCVLLKPHRPAESALGNVTESQTVEELLARERDPTAIMFECLLIAERILGPGDVNTSDLYLQVCCYLSSQSRVSEAVALWLYGKRATRFQNSYRLFDKLCILNIFEDALLKGLPLPFADFVSVLKLVVEEEEEMVICSSQDEECKLSCIRQTNYTLSLFKVAFDMAQCPEHESRLQELVQRFQTVISSLVPWSLLHLAILNLNNCQQFLMDQTFSSWVPFVAFLLKCKCDPNSMDETRNTPLHDIATSFDFGVRLGTACQIARVLLEAGAHVDIHNDQGRTPLEVARTPEVQSILREYYPLSLQCLAAAAVVQHGIAYVDHVPNSVKNFIELHSPGPQSSSRR